MNLIVRIALLISLGLMSSVVMANAKIGVLDMHMVMKEAPQAKSSAKLLKQNFESRKKKIINTHKKFEEKYKSFQRNKSINSKTENIKQERSLSRLQTDLRQLQQEYQADYVVQERAEMEKFIKLVQKAVDVVAKKNKYTVILRKQGTAYAAKNTDITNKILEYLRKKP